MLICSLLSVNIPNNMNLIDCLHIRLSKLKSNLFPERHFYQPKSKLNPLERKIIYTHIYEHNAKAFVDEDIECSITRRNLRNDEIETARKGFLGSDRRKHGRDSSRA